MWAGGNGLQRQHRRDHSLREVEVLVDSVETAQKRQHALPFAGAAGGGQGARQRRLDAQCSPGAVHVKQRKRLADLLLLPLGQLGHACNFWC